MVSTEILLAVIAVIGTIAGAIVYVVRKWADTKQQQALHQMEIETLRVEHQLEMNGKKEERESARISVDREIATYIQSSTETLKGLTDAVKGVQAVLERELSNGLANAVDDNSRRITQLEQTMKAGFGVVGQKLDRALDGS